MAGRSGTVRDSSHRAAPVPHADRHAGAARCTPGNEGANRAPSAAAVRHDGAYRVVQSRQIDGQHLAIQEQQCRQCLGLRAGGDTPMHCQPGQEALDLRGA